MTDPRDLRIVFMGTPEFAAVNLRALITAGFNVVLCCCQPDKPVGRKQILTPPPVKVEAVNNGIEVYQPATLRTDDAYIKIKEANPDMIVTAAYGKILPVSILDIPRFGCINCHGSLLPARRGSAPVQRAVMEGDTVTGITIMMMAEGMDTGDMLVQKEIAIGPDMHSDELMTALAELSASILPQAVTDLSEGRLTSVKQDETKATYCPPIASEEGHFTWDMPVSVIHNKVRALSSWPGAYTEAGDRKLKIYDSRIVDMLPAFADMEAAKQALPGTIVASKGADLIVKCGDGYLKIVELQFAGGKRLNARDIAHNYKPGQTFS